MFSGVLSVAWEKAVWLNHSGAPRGGENGETSPPLSDPRGPFSTTSMKCCRLPLSTLSENKEITSPRVSMPVLQDSI